MTLDEILSLAEILPNESAPPGFEWAFRWSPSIGNATVTRVLRSRTDPKLSQVAIITFPEIAEHERVTLFKLARLRQKLTSLNLVHIAVAQAMPA